MIPIDKDDRPLAAVVCVVGWSLIGAGLYGLYRLACLLGASFPLFTIGGF